MSNIDKTSLTNPGTTPHVKKVQGVTPLGSDQPRQTIADGGKGMPSAHGADHHTETQRDKIARAAQDVSGYIQNISREINFSVDEELGETIITVIDDETGDVIRQIPGEEILEMAKNIANMKVLSSKGMLFQGDV